MSGPGPNTSHYGRALWHLDCAGKAVREALHYEEAQYHLAAAQVHAILHQAMVTEGTPPNGPTEWGAAFEPQPEVDPHEHLIH